MRTFGKSCVIVAITIFLLGIGFAPSNNRVYSSLCEAGQTWACFKDGSQTLALFSLIAAALAAYGILIVAIRPPAKKDDEDRIPCPYCAESIKLDAVLCPFCRSDLTSKSRRRI